MPQYRPEAFWDVLFTGPKGGSAIPNIVPRSILMALPSVLPVLCREYAQEWFDDVLMDGSALTQPFTILVGLLIAFRLGDAYKKWDLGARCLTDLHSSANLVTSMLCSY